MQRTILVLLTENTEWMREAIHQAAQSARRSNAQLVLLKLIPMQHVGWLGTTDTFIPFTELELKILKIAEATAEDYGVAICVEPFQYVTLTEALFDAAVHFQAAELYAALPVQWMAFWRAHKLRWLRNELTQQQVQLNTLENVTEVATPSLNATPVAR